MYVYVQVIRQQLMIPRGFISAARELLDWCGDVRAFQPHYEAGLMACLQVVSQFSASPGFDLHLGWYCTTRTCISYAYIRAYDNSRTQDKIRSKLTNVRPKSSISGQMLMYFF